MLCYIICLIYYSYFCSGYKIENKYEKDYYDDGSTLDD